MAAHDRSWVKTLLDRWTQGEGVCKGLGAAWGWQEHLAWSSSEPGARLFLSVPAPSRRGSVSRKRFRHLAPFPHHD